MSASTTPAGDGLTPLLVRFRGPVTRALRTLLALDPWVGLAWRLHGERLLVQMTPVDGRGVSLLLRQGEGAGWAVGPGLRVTVQKPPGPLDAGQNRLLRGLAAHLTSGPSGGNAVLAAWQAWRPYDRAEDRMYRQLSRSTLGPMGTLRFGFGCSQDCHFCWQSRAWPDAPDDLLFTWLDELAEAGIETLSISGGEPTLHRALPGLIARATRDHGLRVHLQTNAIKLREPDYLAQLQDAGLDSVLVSLHSADPAVSDAMTRAPGTWQHTVAGVERCLAAGLFVALNCCVERANWQGVPGLADLIVSRFPGAQIVNLSQPSDYFEPGSWAESVVPLDTVRPAVVAATRTLREAGIQVNATGSCGFPVCVFREEPELIQTIPRADLNPLDLEGRSDASVCEGCSAQATCPGVRREYLALHGERGLQQL